MAADSLSRDLQLLPVDSSAALDDHPAVAAQPLPTPAPAPKPVATKPKPKPAPKPAPSRRNRLRGSSPAPSWLPRSRRRDQGLERDGSRIDVSLRTRGRSRDRQRSPAHRIVDGCDRWRLAITILLAAEHPSYDFSVVIRGAKALRFAGGFRVPRGYRCQKFHRSPATTSTRRHKSARRCHPAPGSRPPRTSDSPIRTRRSSARRDRGASHHADLVEMAGDDSGMRGPAPHRGQDPVGYRHPGEIGRGGVAADEKAARVT